MTEENHWVGDVRFFFLAFGRWFDLRQYFSDPHHMTTLCPLNFSSHNSNPSPHTKKKKKKKKKEPRKTSSKKISTSSIIRTRRHLQASSVRMVYPIRICISTML